MIVVHHDDQEEEERELRSHSGNLALKAENPPPRDQPFYFKSNPFTSRRRAFQQIHFAFYRAVPKGVLREGVFVAKCRRELTI